MIRTADEEVLEDTRAGAPGSPDSVTLHAYVADRRMAELADVAALRAMDPRLVLVDARGVSVVSVAGAETAIGGGGVPIDPGPGEGVKARIRRVGRHFFWEDMGSTVTTLVDHEPAPMGATWKLESGSLVSAGRAQLLFVTRTDRHGVSRRPVFRLAAALVIRGGGVGARRMRGMLEIAEEEEKDPGELLIAARLVSPAEWHDAVRRAEKMHDPLVATMLAEARRRQRSVTLVVGTVAAGLLVAGLLVAALASFLEG